MVITIPDDVALKYQDMATRAHLPLERVLARQLQKFADVPTGAQVIPLWGDALVEADRLLGLGATKDAESLLKAIRAWAGITIGDIRLDFSPAQLAEIAHRADKQGKSPEQIVREIVEQMNVHFFHDAVVMR